MSIDKLIKKYSEQGDGLPPPSEEVEQVAIPAPPKVPRIPKLTQKQMGEFFNMRYNPEDSPRLQKHIENLQRLEEIQRQENLFNFLKNDPEEVQEGEEEPTDTKPGNKRRSDYPTLGSSKTDQLLKRCEEYCELAHKK